MRCNSSRGGWAAGRIPSGIATERYVAHLILSNVERGLMVRWVSILLLMGRGVILQVSRGLGLCVTLLLVMMMMCLRMGVRVVKRGLSGCPCTTAATISGTTRPYIIGRGVSPCYCLVLNARL